MMMTSLLAVAAIAFGLIVLAVAFAWRVRPAVVHDHASHRPRVAIIGGGFAGVYTAQYLEKLGKDRIEIVLISPRNHFVFHPMLPEVISGSIGIMDVVSPIRRMLPLGILRKAGRAVPFRGAQDHPLGQPALLELGGGRRHGGVGCFAQRVAVDADRDRRERDGFEVVIARELELSRDRTWCRHGSPS